MFHEHDHNHNHHYFRTGVLREKLLISVRQDQMEAKMLVGSVQTPRETMG